MDESSKEIPSISITNDTPILIQPISISEISEVSEVSEVSEIYQITDVSEIPEVCEESEKLTLDFEKLLKNHSLKSNAALQNFKTRGMLTDLDRSAITEAVANAILQLNHLPTASEYNIAATKLCELFPCETKGSYYCPPTGKHKNASGKLPDKIKNIKYQIKKKAAGSWETSLSESSFVPSETRITHPAKFAGSCDPNDSAIKTAIAHLKYDNIESWPELLRSWSVTHPLRFQYLRETRPILQQRATSSVQQESDALVNDYFKNWPVLTLPNGYLLIQQDFKELYPGREDDLISKWDSTKEVLINLLNAEIAKSDEYGRKLLIDLTATDIDKNDPTLVFIGPTLSNITASYVQIDSVRYELRTPLKALDTCFKYNSVKAFRKHLKDKHSAHMLAEMPLQALHQAEVHENLALNFNMRNALEQIDNPNEQIGDMRNIAITALDFKKAIFESSRALIAKLYASTTLNRVQVQEIIELFSDFCSGGFITMFRFKTLSMLQAAEQRQNDMQQLIEMFNTIQNVFQGLETETQRVNALKASQSYICPQTYRIGVSEKMIKVGNVAVLRPIKLTGQYIPMRYVLKNFLELPGVFDAILTNIENLNNSEKFINIIQSPLWKNIKDSNFKDGLMLLLFIYFDDVEPDNQTGSHAADHSLGAIYYQIPCIPQHHMSTLENIFVSSIFLSNDKHLNNKNAFRPVINELKYLEDNGILVHTATGNQRVYFCLCLLLADNLGLHSITGFTESFNANYNCRFCKKHKVVMKKQLRENLLLLRNTENYEADVFVNNVLLTDLMHDLLEGVTHYNFCAILEELISVKRYFTLQTLNDRVQNFDYSFDIEILFFVRHFGLMIGDLVPEVEEVWQLYIRFIQILDIVTAPFVDTNLTTYLATLIAEHHELYCKLFSKTLKPKHHIM
ncbi:hypothetical protein RF55_12125, partial [Lasius niger]